MTRQVLVPVSLAAQLLWATDNTHDIGANGATRPRDLYLGRNATIGGTAVISSYVLAPWFWQYGDGNGIVFQRQTSDYGKQYYLSIDTARGMVFDKGGGDTGANANTLFKFQTIGSVDANNPYWNGLQFLGHSITESAVAKYPGLSLFARSASAADPTDYEFLFCVDGTTVSTLGLSFVSKNVTNSFVRFGFGNSSLSVEAFRTIYNGSVANTVFGATSMTGTDKVTVNGRVGMTAFRLGTSATANQVLMADANGVGTWQNQVSATSVAFTDGDTARRVTITDAAVVAGSKILPSVRRPDSTDDSADKGYVYTANVVKVASGSFDVLISALDWGGMDCTEDPPNETVTLTYMVAS